MIEQISKLKSGDHLTQAEMADAMNQITEGNVDEEQIIIFLETLAIKGENVDELTGATQVLREKATKITGPFDAVDCCGTGGDAKGTYNISTAVALVAASCGVPIAKHGNRAASSKSGTADVLEAMGVNLNLDASAIEQALQEFGFAFLMAPQHHKAMKHVASARKEIGKRTIFNLLGPLLNPAGMRYQLIGVFDKKWLVPIAKTLHNLGTKRAWIVHGNDGLDEITLTSHTDIVTLDEEGIINEQQLKPEDFGLPTYSLKELKGGDSNENALALRALLEGQQDAYRDVVLANTSAVLKIHGRAETLHDGVDIARHAIDSGSADALLKDYITYSRQFLEKK